MILLACRETAKHAPFLVSELGPRNAATDEEVKNAREKMLPSHIRNIEVQTGCDSEK
jgi:hypothetical protein